MALDVIISEEDSAGPGDRREESDGVEMVRQKSAWVGAVGGVPGWGP